MLKTICKRILQINWIRKSILAKKGRGRLYYAALHCQQRIWDKKLETIFPEEKVYTGPFEGMKFSKDATWGNIWPKIMGCYESELAEIFCDLPNRGYEVIVDVGSAEGYYSCGMAYLCKNSKVIAYDTSESARLALKRNVTINGLSERVVIKDFCTDEELSKINFAKKGFILSDCEGFEEKLFTQKSISNLKNVDVLVEVHDEDTMYHEPESIYDKLIKLFADTHDVRVITAVSTKQKIAEWNDKQKDRLSDEELEYAVSEGRQYRQDWLLFSAREIV